MPASVHLIVGDSDFLAERARHSIIAEACTAVGHDIPVTTVRTGDITVDELADLLSPSLFSLERIVVCIAAHEAGDEPTRLLLEVAAHPPDGVTLIIIHSGGGRQKKMVKKLSSVAEVHTAARIKNYELPQFVLHEFRSHGVRPTSDVVDAVLAGVGSDLRELASAISQLVADNDGDVDVHAVKRFYSSVAEVSGFDIADLACSGQTERAVASTRRALQLGVSPVLISAALSGSIGAIARLYSVRGRGNSAELAGLVGMPPWKVDKTLKVARRWEGRNVSRAVVVVAELDAAVKGKGRDPDYAIEFAVRRIAELAP